MPEREFETVIGLEVHVTLNTNTKLFCRCRNSFGGEPNTRICPICTGQPGALPVINRKAIDKAIIASCVLNCKNILDCAKDQEVESSFVRKQYFYPDLPKNYQISQYEMPLAENGFLELDNRKIKITRAHLEEDAGKLIHMERDVSFIDYNRSGTPLLEIVSEPEIRSPLEAVEYLKTIRQIMRYCSVSDCEMENGLMRSDANISLKEANADQLGVKTELKNMNTFKSVEKALNYEVKRQKKLLSLGQRIIQETRLWDEDKKMTFTMRSKEVASDYRYFPDPDLPILVIDGQRIDMLRSKIPELPLERKKRYMKEFGLSEYYAKAISQEKEISDYFENALEQFKTKNISVVKMLINWITVELLGKMHALEIEFSDQPIDYKQMAELVQLIENEKISMTMAKDIFKYIWKTDKSPKELIVEEGIKQISSNEEIEKVCRSVIEENQVIVRKYLGGKEGVIAVLVENVMKATQGQANPKIVNEKLRTILSEDTL